MSISFVTHSETIGELFVKKKISCFFHLKVDVLSAFGSN